MWEWFRSLDDHTFNRAVATLDLISFPLIAQEVISEKALAGIRDRATNLMGNISKASRVAAMSFRGEQYRRRFRDTDIIMDLKYPNLTIRTFKIGFIISVLTTIYIALKLSGDTSGRSWYDTICDFLEIASFTFVFSITTYFGSFYAFLILTSTIALRFRVFCIGATLFGLGRLAILMHG